MAEVEELLEGARRAVEAGEPEKAATLLYKALQIEPQDVDLYLALGEALVDTGKLTEAIAVLEKGYSLSPQHEQLLFALGDACFEAHAAARALEVYSAIVNLGGDGVVDAWVSIGLVHFNQERVDEAVKCYQEALKRDPNSVFALNSLGDGLFAQGKTDEAITSYRRVVEIDPDDAQAHYNLAELYYDLEDLVKAESECRRAIELDPALSFAWLTLGNICLDQEKPAEALHSFQEFLRHEQSPAAADIRNEVAAVIDGLKAEQ